MTDADRRELAEAVYASPEAAALLMRDVVTCPDAETRLRARVALLALDQLEPFPDPSDRYAHAIGAVFVAILRTADEHERKRLANLLDAVMREAQAIAERARPAA